MPSFIHIKHDHQPTCESIFDVTGDEHERISIQPSNSDSSITVSGLMSKDLCNFWAADCETFGVHLFRPVLHASF